MFSNRRILIFTGGNLGNWALQEVKAGDFLLGVDRGALFLLRNNLKPDYVLGDFDSVTAEELEEIRQGCRDLFSCDPVLKDYTDTEMAFSWAMDRSPEEIVLLGALGTRLDHTLANVQLLYKGLERGISCRIIDERNEIMLINNAVSLSQGRFTYVSLLPFSAQVTGITLEGFQYPLCRAVLHIGDSLAVSNVLTEETGRIYVDSGQLLVIRSRD